MNRHPDPNNRPELPDPGTPDAIRLSPLTVADLCLCAIAILLGLLYLNTTWIPLSVLLPAYIVIFSLIPILRLFDAKKKQTKGLAAWIPVIGWFLMDAIVIVAACAYFAGA